MKGEVARSGPHPNLLSVRNTLLNAFKEKISSKVIVGLWRRALKNTKEYFESDENVQLIDEEFDDHSNSDNMMNSFDLKVIFSYFRICI